MFCVNAQCRWGGLGRGVQYDLFIMQGKGTAAIVGGWGVGGVGYSRACL